MRVDGDYLKGSAVHDVLHVSLYGAEEPVVVLRLVVVETDVVVEHLHRRIDEREHGNELLYLWIAQLLEQHAQRDVALVPVVELTEYTIDYWNLLQLGIKRHRNLQHGGY